MARRKNTAEAFEILAEIAREKEALRGAAATGGAAPAGSPPDPHASQGNFRPGNFRLIAREVRPPLPPVVSSGPVPRSSRTLLLKAPAGRPRAKWQWKGGSRSPEALPLERAPAALPAIPSLPPLEEERRPSARPVVSAPPVEEPGRSPSKRKKRDMSPLEGGPPSPPPSPGGGLRTNRRPFLARWCSERPARREPPVTDDEPLVPVGVAMGDRNLDALEEAVAHEAREALLAPPVPVWQEAREEPAPGSETEAGSQREDTLRIELLEAREPPVRFGQGPLPWDAHLGEAREAALVSGGGGHPGPACAARGDGGPSAASPRPPREPESRREVSGGHPPEKRAQAASQEPMESGAAREPGPLRPQDTGVPEPGADSESPEMPRPEAVPSVGNRETPSEEGARARSPKPGLVVIGSGWLERAIELRLSTVLALGMTGMIALVLVLTYLKLPHAEDPRLRNFMALAPEAGSAAQVPVLSEASAMEGESPSDGGRPLSGLSRPVPIWSPRSVPPEGVARDPAETATSREEIRSIENTAVSGAPAEPAAGGGGAVAEAAREGAGFIHRIQVRAKESMTGAHQIVEYLALFGFDPARAVIERDRHGDRNAQGLALYTVFVGQYGSHEEASSDLDKLKSETRARPFKDRDAFREMFQDSIVVRRRR